MKNSSKTKYSNKFKKQDKKDSDYNFHSKNANRSRRNNISPNNTFKNKEVNNLNESDKKKLNLSYTKSTKSKNKASSKFSYRTKEIHHDLSNKKNFEDWIWGKHSVFEALTNERAINRIWCTTEIFSSEKFYILLKKHKFIKKK